MRATVTKVRNFEGYYFNCCRCGKEIKHAYTIDNNRGVYGSECVHTVANVSDKDIKDQDSRMKSVIKMMENRKRYSWDEYCDAHGYNDEQMINHYLKTGRLS